MGNCSRLLPCGWDVGAAVMAWCVPHPHTQQHPPTLLSPHLCKQRAYARTLPSPFIYGLERSPFMYARVTWRRFFSAWTCYFRRAFYFGTPTPNNSNLLAPSRRSSVLPWHAIADCYSLDRTRGCPTRGAANYYALRLFCDSNPFYKHNSLLDAFVYFILSRSCTDFGFVLVAFVCFVRLFRTHFGRAHMPPADVARCFDVFVLYLVPSIGVRSFCVRVPNVW